MLLAKPAIDCGVLTNNLDPNLAFWSEQIGLPYEELLKVGGGVHQHRLSLHGAVLKLNSARSPLASGATGLRALRIAAAIEEPRELTSPDGCRVSLVPFGFESVDATEVLLAVADVGHTAHLLVEGLSAVNESADRFRLGESLIQLVAEPGRTPTGTRNVVGYSYLTVQIFDVEAEHDRLLGLGFTEGLAPVKLGETAYISFVRFPDGDWLELSQRASLTGLLPSNVRST